MWPWLIPAGIGAVTSGLAAASQGKDVGGVLGAAALGGGLGALVPAGGRMAGTLLSELPLATRVAPSVYKAGQMFAGGKNATSLVNPLAQQMLGRQAIASGASGLTQAGLGLAVPAAATVLAGGAGQVLGGAGRAAQAALGGASAMGAGRPGTPDVYPFSQYAVPQVNRFGGVDMLGSNPLDVSSLIGPFASQRLIEEMETDTQARNMQKLLATTTPWTEGAKKAEMLRQLTASGVRTNQATQAQMTLNAQRSAQQMGANALNTGLQALAGQYQYG